jgi:hypothetical protein
MSFEHVSVLPSTLIFYWLNFIKRFIFDGFIFLEKIANLQVLQLKFAGK